MKVFGFVKKVFFIGLTILSNFTNERKRKTRLKSTKEKDIKNWFGIKKKR